MQHLDALTDADSRSDAMDKDHEAQSQAEAAYIVEFMSACQKLDANAIAMFAPLTTDWDHEASALYKKGSRPMRMRRLSEVMEDALGIFNGPKMEQVMQLVISLGFSADSHADQSKRARQLLASMAQASASNNVVLGD